MKGRRASAYLFAAIIVMTVAVMIALTLRITRYGALLSYAAMDNDDLHYLAADAAELITNELNEILREKLGDIEAKTDELLTKSKIKTDITDYVAYNADTGQLHLKQKDTTSKNGAIDTLYSKYFITAAETVLYADISRLTQYGRSFEINEREISAALWREDDMIAIEVTARDASTGAVKKVLAFVDLISDAHEEIIFEQYEFLTRPEYMDASNGGVTLSAAGYTGEGELPAANWNKENPIAVAEDGEVIDTDLFHGVPTILIARGDVQLSGSNDEFYGLVYAEGTVIIGEGLSINGAVAAKEVTEEKSDEEEETAEENKAVIYEDNFFNIKIENRELRRQVYDYLGLTNFSYKQTGYVLRTKDLKEEVLKCLKLSSDFGLAVSDIPQFKIVTLQ